MIRTLLSLLAAKLPPPRIIFDRAGKSPYLSRWYLLGRPTMPDGSHPFTEDGSPKEGILDPDRLFAVFLHKFHRGDDDAELHNHPWKWALSLVLSGGYREERRRGAPERGGAVSIRTVFPWTLNLIHHDTFHRVDLLGEDAWSLFLAGPREKTWGFWNRSTGRYMPWRDFITWRRSTLARVRFIDSQPVIANNTDARASTPYQADPWQPAREGDRFLSVTHRRVASEVTSLLPYEGGCVLRGDGEALLPARRYPNGKVLVSEASSSQDNTFYANARARQWQRCVQCSGELGESPSPILVPADEPSGYRIVSWFCETCSREADAPQGEPLVEVDLYAWKKRCEDDDCFFCDAVVKRAESGLEASHRSLILR